MNRALEDVSRTKYDLLIIGGGIYGACVARDAAFRGLRVALLEKGDFGHATSSNSHKIIHGGLRYLQHGNLARMRESIKERSTLVRIAPHLVKPMPFLIPTYQHIGAKKSLLRIALKINDLIAFDRNHKLPEASQFPSSCTLSKEESLEHCGVINQSRLTGGGYYFDAQVHNPERLLLSMLLSAHAHGADILNYVNVSKLLLAHGSVIGVEAEDVLNHNLMDIQAKFVVNCGGPWLDQIMSVENDPVAQFRIPLLKAMVLVTNSIVNEVGLGVPSQYSYVDVDAIINNSSRYFFITPWRNRSLVGTFQTHYDGNPDDASVTDEEIETQLGEVNACLPDTKMTRNDVQLVNWGLLPRSDAPGLNKDVQLAKHSMIYDHEKIAGIRGIISVSGVKFTTARAVAEKTINLVLSKFGEKPIPCTTGTVPVYGGNICCQDTVLREAMEQKPNDLSFETVHHIVNTYGSAFSEIFQYSGEDHNLSSRVVAHMPVTKAEVVHGVRKEMAQTLSDIIFRRTALGTTGHPGTECLQTCVMLMAKEMEWNERRIQSELYETKIEYQRRGVR